MTTPEIPSPRSRAEGNGSFGVCFVCTGNICRSPMGEVVLRSFAEQILLGDDTSLSAHLDISSAGTDGWHEGEPMDPRTRGALEAAGFVDHGHRARHFDPDHFDRVDLVVAMDRGHYQSIGKLAPNGSMEGRIVLLRWFDPMAGEEVDVPDPYYQDGQFAPVLSMIERGCAGLAAALERLLGAPS